MTKLFWGIDFALGSVAFQDLSTSCCRGRIAICKILRIALSGERRKLLFPFHAIASGSYRRHENDPPKRVIGLALASILILKMSYLVFPGFWEGQDLAFGTYGRTAAGGAAGTCGRATAAGRASARAAVASAIASSVIAVVASTGVLAVLVTLTLLVVVLIRVAAPAEERPRMTIVITGKG